MARKVQYTKSNFHILNMTFGLEPYYISKSWEKKYDTPGIFESAWSFAMLERNKYMKRQYELIVKGYFEIDSAISKGDMDALSEIVHIVDFDRLHAKRNFILRRNNLRSIEMYEEMVKSSSGKKKQRLLNSIESFKKEVRRYTRDLKQYMEDRDLDKFDVKADENFLYMDQEINYTSEYITFLHMIVDEVSEGPIRETIEKHFSDKFASLLMLMNCYQWYAKPWIEAELGYEARVKPITQKNLQLIALLIQCYSLYLKRHEVGLPEKKRSACHKIEELVKYELGNSTNEDYSLVPTEDIMNIRQEFDRYDNYFEKLVNHINNDKDLNPKFTLSDSEKVGLLLRTLMNLDEESELDSQVHSAYVEKIMKQPLLEMPSPWFSYLML